MLLIVSLSYVYCIELSFIGVFILYSMFIYVRRF